MCLSRYLVNEEVLYYRNKITPECVDNILYDLDMLIAPFLKKQLNIQMKLFMPLYSFIGKYAYHSYLCVIKAIKRVIDLYGLEELIFYQNKFFMFMNVETDMKELVASLDVDIRIKILEDIHLKKNRYFDILTRLKANPLYHFKKGYSFLKNRMTSSQINVSSKNILISEPLLYLDFIKKSIYGKYNVITVNYLKRHALKLKSLELICNITSDIQKLMSETLPEDPFQRLFLNILKKNFLRYINYYLSVIYFLKMFNREHKIALGVWGDPPSSGVNALIFEWLRTEGVPVVGAQHGNLYAEIYNPWIMSCDFTRCDYYLSWGFTNDDLKSLYKNIDQVPRIFSFGRPERQQRRKNNKVIDILFPLTHSLSLFSGGVSNRTLPHKLTEVQVNLLEFLNSLEGLRIYIKPFAFSTYRNSSVLPVLRRLKNLKVVHDRSLTDFLKVFTPRAVIIEHPASPLVDVIHLDTEIFLMNNEIMPYEEKVLELLKRRVHYSENVDDMISMIKKFLEGGLEKKRDNTYYNRFVYKENANENILNFIDGLIKYG
jgi:hypothetical protein